MAQALKSWVPYPADSHFPIQNLPYGVFSTKQNPERRIGVAIGDQILDVKAASKAGLLSSKAAASGALNKETLNEFMGLGKEAWKEVRADITQLLTGEKPKSTAQAQLLVKQEEAIMHLPVVIGDYTDFYTCEEHARNATGIRTGMRLLAPNWLHMPIAYHSRSSSVVISGTNFHRPKGQVVPPPQGNFISRYIQSWLSVASAQPVQKPSSAVDLELEMAFLVGSGNKLGESIGVDKADDHIFGMVLMNDWSARDLQKWEMLPLGPFNSKNFLTAISPWVVPMQALEPFREEAPRQNPEPLPYLAEKGRKQYSIELQATLQPEGREPAVITNTNFKQLYWTPKQMLAHHTFGGCNVRPGDLMGTGTISSPGPKGQGCLLEQSWGASKEVQLDNATTRRFLEDGDTVRITGFCQGEGFRVGFGECTGTVLPALH